MDRHVSNDAIAVLHEGAPAARMRERAVRAYRRRSGPEFVIEIRRRRGIRRVRCRAHVVVTMNIHLRDLAKPSRVEEPLLGFDNMRRAAALRAHLYYTVIPAGGCHHGPSFGYIDADGLLTINIGARLGGFNHGEGVPVIRRGDEADIETALFQHVAIVVEELRFLTGFLARSHDVRRLGKLLRIHVAKRDDFDGFNLNQPEQIDLAVPAGPDESYAPRLPCRLREGCRPCREGCGEKASAIHASEYMPAFRQTLQPRIRGGRPVLQMTRGLRSYARCRQFVGPYS